MALVGVEDLDVLPRRPQGAHPADPEEDLLAHAVLGVAGVEAVGHRPGGGVVLLDVGVEQVELHATDHRPPQLGDQRRAGQVDRDPGAVDPVESHRVGVEAGVALLLPAVGVELLAEVALLVEEAHADEGDTEAAFSLE